MSRCHRAHNTGLIIHSSRSRLAAWLNSDVGHNEALVVFSGISFSRYLVTHGYFKDNSLDRAA